MPWTPEDLEARTASEARASRSAGADEALLELIERLPGRSSRTVVDFGCRDASRLEALSRCFAEVLALTDSESRLARLRADGPEADVRYAMVDFADLSAWAGSVDVAVACDAHRLIPAGGSLDGLIEGLYGTLRDGGILILTLPAAQRIGGPVELHLGRKASHQPPSVFHEVELQYRIRRAGFQGLRIQRFAASQDSPPTLFCVAARRASN